MTDPTPAWTCPTHVLPCDCAPPVETVSTTALSTWSDGSTVARDALLMSRPLEAARVLSEIAPPSDDSDDEPQDALSSLSDVPEELARMLADPASRELLLRAPEVLAALEVELWRLSLSDFIKAGWHVIEPSTKLEWNWHHQLICDVAQGMFEDWLRAKDDRTFVQRVTQAVLNVPPGSLKSRILSVFFPVWIWLREPGFKVIALSVNQEASFRDGRASRELIRSDWFQRTFRPAWKLREDQDSISNYGNTAGGDRISRAQASEIVGLRADCLRAGSMVATEIGDVAIEDLCAMIPGTWPRVWALDHETGMVELRAMQATRVIEDRETVVVSVDGKEVLHCTPDHKIWTTNGYVEAGNLDGSYLYELHERSTEFGYCSSTITDSGSTTVYDIQIEGLHNFFAGTHDLKINVSNCLICDDPNNPKEAENANERNYVNELWDANIYNRVNDMRRSFRIGVQQRTHALDWSGHVLKSQGFWDPVTNPRGWLHVVLPAEFEVSRKCVTPWGSDPRTVEGESIHPERMTPEVLASERARFGADKYAGQMQQRPALAEGSRVKRSWWGFFRLAKLAPACLWPEAMAFAEEPLERPRPVGCVPAQDIPDKNIAGVPARVVGGATHRSGWDFDWVAITMDPAVKRTVRGSNWGILVVGGKGARRFVLDDVTQRGDTPEILRVLRKLILKWRPDRLLVEDKAAGDPVMSMLREELQDGLLRDESGRAIGLVIEPIKANGEYEARVDAVLPIIEQGNVFLLEGAAWLADLVEEISMYPMGERDDRTDSLAQCLAHMRDSVAGIRCLPQW